MREIQVACHLTMRGQTPAIGGDADVEAPEVVEHLSLRCYSGTEVVGHFYVGGKVG